MQDPTPQTLIERLTAFRCDVEYLSVRMLPHPAEKVRVLGLNGDIILEADGQPVSVTSDLLTVRRSHSVGDTIRLTIQRDGQALTVDVVLYASK